MKRPSPQAHKSRLLQRRAILILGMHRSGTSALSGLACTLGASAPNNLLPANFANPHGYWESVPLVQAHDELLASADSSWDDWRRISPQWYGSEDAQRFHGRIRDILKSEYDEKPLFVVKDPRLCRFVPFFLSVLKGMAVTPVALLSLRDPLEVAFSLRRRDGFSISKSVALWLRHVLEAEVQSREMPRFIISYENLMKDWRGQMDRASEITGIVWPNDPESSAKAIEEFLKMDLYHEKSEPGGLEKHPDLLFLAAETYRLLCAISKMGSGPDLLSQIDAVRAKFDEASDFFGAIFRTEEIAIRQLRTQLKQNSFELEQQKVHQQQLNDQIHQRERERAEYVARIGQLGDQLEELRDSSAKNESGLNMVITEVSAALDRKDSEHKHLIGDLASSRNALDDVKSALAASCALSERLTHEVKEIGRRQEELQAEVLRKEVNIGEMNREIETYKKRVEELQSLLVERNEQNQAMVARINALYLSRSWRLTRPLRAASRFFYKATSH